MTKPAFNPEEWAAAYQRFTDDPAALQDTDLRVLEIGGGAAMVQRAREARTKAWAAASAANPEDAWDEFVKQHGDRVKVTVRALDTVYQFVKEQKKAHGALETRVTELETKLDAQAAENATLKAHVATLENQPRLVKRGAA